MTYKTIPIVKVKPIDKYFTIVWQVDLRCNFDCMYCPASFHDLVSQTKTLHELKGAWMKIFHASKDKNLKYKISFTGGEVTVNKDFLPFIKWLHENYNENIFQIGVTTNGSASINYYSKLLNYVDHISFSTHSEFFNEKKFFENIIACHDKIKNTQKTIQVNIMEEPWHKQRIETYMDFFNKNGINYSVNKIDFSVKIREENLTNTSKQFYEF